MDHFSNLPDIEIKGSGVISKTFLDLGIDDFLYTEPVAPNISARDEYRIDRKALSQQILKQQELAGVTIKTVLHAREMGLAVLKANLNIDALVKSRASDGFVKSPKSRLANPAE